MSEYYIQPDNMIIDNILSFACFIYTTAINICTMISTITMNIFANPFVIEFGLNALVLYSETKQYVLSGFLFMYNENENLRNGWNITYYALTWLYNVCMNRRQEPFDTPWLSTSYLLLLHYNEPIYKSVYDTKDYTTRIIEDVVEFDIHLTIMENYVEWFNLIRDEMKYENTIDESIITMRIGDKYIYRICRKDSKDLIVNELGTEASNVKFLNIELCFPDKEPIIMTLDKGALIVGNELFSTAFLKRLYEYQINIHSDFSMDYVLKIMDNNINTFELHKNEYIKLEKNGYDVVKRVAN